MYPIQIMTDCYGIIGFYYQEKLSKQSDSSDQFAFLPVFYPLTVVLNKVFFLLCLHKSFSSFAFASIIRPTKIRQNQQQEDVPLVTHLNSFLRRIVVVILIRP